MNRYKFLFTILIILIGCLYIRKINFVSLGISTNQPFAIPSHEQKVRCIVYAKRCDGRLGNKIFLVASAYGLARLHSCHLYIAPEIVHEMKKVFIFNLSSLIANKISTEMNRTEKNIVCQYLPELTRPNAIGQGMIFELTGYWQSYLHFAKYGDELREDIFVPKQSVLMKVSRFFSELYQQNLGITSQFSFENRQLLKNQLAQLNWIGIHIRRSDFLSLKYSSSDEYIFSAIEYYTSLYLNVYFLVVTDDRPYAKNLFRNRSNIFFTPRSFSPGDDLITLSLCQHSIITGGTFGWWAAYLTNGQVIHDKVYPSLCERREYYYPPWFMINGNIRARIDSEYIL